MSERSSERPQFGTPDDQRQRRNFKVCPEILSEHFERDAPKHWQIIDCDKRHAKFELPSEHVASNLSSPYFFVSVFLDGSLEYKLKRHLYTLDDIEKNRMIDKDILNLYPDIPGFIKYAWGSPLEFDKSRGLRKQSLRYWNREQSIFCLGVFPGDFECLWGDKTKRYSILFHTDDFSPVTSYISHLISGS